MEYLIDKLEKALTREDWEFIRDTVTYRMRRASLETIPKEQEKRITDFLNTKAYKDK